MKEIICSNCKSIIRYNDKSVFEGNRESEEVCCPICNNYLATVFTDSNPNPIKIRKNNKQDT